MNIKKILFSIYQYIYLQPRGFFSLRNERHLVEKKIKSKSEKKSIIFFTTHKAASSFFDKFFNTVIKENDYIKINFDEYILRYPNKDTQNIYYKNSNDKGFIFAPIRKFQEFNKIENYKVVLLLRDPRDVLVSHFYSTLISHPINSTKIIEARENYKKDEIDKYVLSKSDWLLEIYQGYMTNLKNYHYIKYENLIAEPHKIISKLAKYLKISIDKKFLDLLLKDLEPPKMENVKNHKRSGKSGQYITHLKKKTIIELNTKFKNVIDYYNFSL